MRVRFVAGAMIGQEGIVESVTNMRKVVLQVDAMKRAVAFTVNAADLEVIGPYGTDDDDEYEDEEYEDEYEE
jgi:transcription antitermination factor NusG